MNLKIIIGSTRPGRGADRVASWVTSVCREHGALATEVLDLREWQLPLFGGTLATVGDPSNPAFSVPVVKRWNATLTPASFRLMASPTGAAK
jgi:NAD(P)H-dependent FMN reductase